jgi:hypothetical protein
MRDQYNSALRLESYGDANAPSLQTWDLSSESYVGFALNDILSNTNPFRVQKGAPTYALVLSNLGSGHVGVGTLLPDRINGAVFAGTARHLCLSASVGTARLITQGPAAAESYLAQTKGPANQKIVRTSVTGGRYSLATLKDNLAVTDTPFSINLATNNVGIKTINPAYPLQVGDAAANDGNGAHVTTGGVWTNASSREVKQDIEPLTIEQARDTVRTLNPVGFRYKNEPDEHYLGFIAEDVPELVATNDRKSLAPMDITAVLTKIVQDQDARIEWQEKVIERQEKRLEKQDVLLATLTQRLNDLEQKLVAKNSARN